MGPELIPGKYLPYTRSNTRQKLALVLISYLLTYLQFSVIKWANRYETGMKGFYLKGTHYQYLPGMGAKKKTPHNRTSLVPISFQIVR